MDWTASPAGKISSRVHLFVRPLLTRYLRHLTILIWLTIHLLKKVWLNKNLLENSIITSQALVSRQLHLFKINKTLLLFQINKMFFPFKENKVFLIRPKLRINIFNFHRQMKFLKIRKVFYPNRLLMRKEDLMRKIMAIRI